MAFKVNELYVFVEITEDGDESIVQTATAGTNQDGSRTIQIVPLITAGDKMAEKLKGTAQLHANETHHKIKLLKLSNREEVETIEEQLVQEPKNKQAWYK
jgi:hypothetical protein